MYQPLIKFSSRRCEVPCMAALWGAPGQRPRPRAARLHHPARQQPQPLRLPRHRRPGGVGAAVVAGARAAPAAPAARAPAACTARVSPRRLRLSQGVTLRPVPDGAPAKGEAALWGTWCGCNSCCPPACPGDARHINFTSTVPRIRPAPAPPGFRFHSGELRCL